MNFWKKHKGKIYTYLSYTYVLLPAVCIYLAMFVSDALVFVIYGLVMGAGFMAAFGWWALEKWFEPLKRKNPYSWLCPVCGFRVSGTDMEGVDRVINRHKDHVCSQGENHG